MVLHKKSCVMMDAETKLRARIVAALKLAAAADRLDVADHLLSALEVLDADDGSKSERHWLNG